MDLSKLPRLSETAPTPPDPAPAPQNAPPTPGQSAAPPRIPSEIHPDFNIEYRSPIGAEIWISAVIGLIFIMMGWTFARYLVATVAGRPFPTGVIWTEGEKAGTEVSYFDLQGHVFWNDSAMFLFGLALLMEAVVLYAISTNSKHTNAFIRLGVAIAFLATVYNLIVAGIFLNSGIPPIMSLLAVAFGGYITLYLWRMLPPRAARA